MRCSHIITLILAVFVFISCDLNLNAPDSGNNDAGPDTTSKFQNVSSQNLPDGLDGVTQSAKAVDIDNDGDWDIALALRGETNPVLINDGSGNFTAQTVSSLGLDSRDISIGDFNGDNFADLFFATYGPQNSELHLNQNDGSYSDLSNRIPVTGNFTSSQIFDMDGDGSPDILIGSLGQNQLLQNNGSGFFSNQTTQRLPQSTDATQDLTVGDLTGNGQQDIVIANEGGNKILINTGSGFYSDQSSRYPFLNEIEESRDIELADVDNDGDLDIYVANSNLEGGAYSNDRLLINNDGTFSDATEDRLPSITSDSFDAEFADLNNDGEPDILVGNYSGGIKILINSGNGFYEDNTPEWLPEIFRPETMDIELSDYNGDNLVDIYIAVRDGADQLLLQKNE